MIQTTVSSGEATGVSLTSLHKGDESTVVDIVSKNTLGLDDMLENRLAGMGLLPGSHFSVLRKGNSPSRPILLAVGETRIAIGSEIAERILVEGNREERKED